MGKEYTLQEFYLRLKLDIWRWGQVAGWGLVEKVTIDKDSVDKKMDFHTRSLKSYRTSSLIKKQLGLGIYLLDLILLRHNAESGETVSLAIVAIGRNVMDKKETIHCLRVTSKIAFNDLKNTILTGQPSRPVRKRRSSLRRA